MRGWILPLLAVLAAGCSPQSKGPDFPEPETLPAVQLAEKPPESVSFGEPVNLHLRISSTERLALPPMEDWLEKPVELISETSTELQREDRWQKDVQARVAIYAVTNTPVFVSTPLLETPEIILPFVSLEVTSRLDADVTPVPKFGSDELPDFRGPKALGRRTRNLWIAFGSLVLLILLAAVALWKWRTRVIPPPPPVPAHRKALASLEELEGTDIWTRPDVDAAAVALSLILRTYIENRFGIQAPDLTTEEFLLTVEKQAPWSEENQAGLKRFFTATDRIKFAGERPERDVLDELMASVREFIDQTKQEGPA
jgi:hypothetical protein